MFDPTDFNPADFIRARFSYETAAAFLGNTRTHIFGTDALGGLAEAANTEPGTFPFGALDFLNAEGAPGDGSGAGAPGAGVVYDCATGKCSDGRSLGFSRWLDRLEACNFRGASAERDKLLADICSSSPAMQRNDGTTGTSPFGGFGSSWGTSLLGITDADKQKYVKQFAFILLAVVLIYAALRSIN